jgi:hypothetical protein
MLQLALCSQRFTVKEKRKENRRTGMPINLKKTAKLPFISFLARL